MGTFAIWFVNFLLAEFSTYLDLRSWVVRFRVLSSSPALETATNRFDRFVFGGGGRRANGQP